MEHRRDDGAERQQHARLYLHPLHKKVVGHSPMAGRDLEKEFVCSGDADDAERQPLDLKALPPVDLINGQLAVMSRSSRKTKCTIPVQLREAVLGHNPWSGLPVIALASSSSPGSRWLILVDSDTDAARFVLGAMARFGAIRRDFSAQYIINTNRLGKGATAAVFGVVEKQSRYEGCVGGLVGKVLLQASPEERAGDVPTDIRQEVTTLAAVQRHPNVVEFHGLFHVADHSQRLPSPWLLLLECCDGGDLFDAVHARTFSEERARDTMAGVLSALAHVHRRRIIHRDIKPENVLIAGDGRAVLSDFGIACYLDDAQEMERTCGTPGYAAPEIIDKRPYQETVDCFGCGALAFFLICGRTPFAGPHLDAVLLNTQRCIVDFGVSRRFQGVTGHCKDIILALLKKMPRQRLSAEDALKHRWITQEPAESPRPTPMSYVRSESMVANCFVQPFGEEGEEGEKGEEGEEGEEGDDADALLRGRAGREASTSSFSAALLPSPSAAPAPQPVEPAGANAAGGPGSSWHRFFSRSSGKSKKSEGMFSSVFHSRGSSTTAGRRQSIDNPESADEDPAGRRADTEHMAFASEASSARGYLRRGLHRFMTRKKGPVSYGPEQPETPAEPAYRSAGANAAGSQQAPEPAYRSAGASAAGSQQAVPEPPTGSRRPAGRRPAFGVRPAAGGSNNASFAGSSASASTAAGQPPVEPAAATPVPAKEHVKDSSSSELGRASFAPVVPRFDSEVHSGAVADPEAVPIVPQPPQAPRTDTGLRRRGLASRALRFT